MLRAASRASKRVEALLSPRLHHGFANALCTLSGKTSFSPSASSSDCSYHPDSRPTKGHAFLRHDYKGAIYSEAVVTRRHRFYTTASTAIATAKVSGTDSSSESTTQDDAPVNVEGVREKFLRLGLNANISRQLTLTHPHIVQPTSAQSALIPAILSPTDIILRAHTGTGKSFGILLALLSKPRIVFKHPTPQEAESSSATTSKRRKVHTGIASIIIVPSNELAFQYLRWARTLFPAPSLPSLDPVIQCLVRGGLPGSEALTPEQELKRLKSSPPHILIGTPGRIKDILDTPAGTSLLGIDTLRTLVLDEADAVLQLPGRFPSHKQRWKHEVHKAPGLLVLDSIMKRRATHSGGEKHLSAGLENRPGRRKDEKRPPEHVRRNTYKAAERSSASREDPNTGLALPRARGPGIAPLQLICTSATANSVMRHFFGARTGWLRTGAKESGLAFAPQVGRWIDLTGLSGKSMVDQGIRGLFGANERSRTESLVQSSLDQPPSTVPANIEHTCVVVDEAPLSRQLTSSPLRHFEPKLARKKSNAPLPADGDTSSLQDTSQSNIVGDDFIVVKPQDEPQEHEMDQTLIEALAFCFASEGVDRGLALIPARWSLVKTRAALEALGITVRFASDVAPAASTAKNEIGNASAGPELFLLQTTSSRGLDIPSLTHVFLIGYASVIDAVQYVHSAGRVGRMGDSSDAPAHGKVVTLLRGLAHGTPIPTSVDADVMGADSSKPRRAISSSEAKMANVYRRLGVVPKKFDLGLLISTSAKATTPSEHSQMRSDEPQSAAVRVEDPAGSEAVPPSN